MCTTGKPSASPEEASTTGRPDRDPHATQDDPAKFLTQDRCEQSSSRWRQPGGSAHPRSSAHGGGAVDRCRGLAQAGRGQGRADLGELCARPSRSLASETARSSSSSAQRPKLSSSSRTTPASATGRRPCSAARRAASAHLGERNTDRGGLLLQHGRPDTLARHHDRERHLHHLLGGHPADAPDDLGIDRGPQGLARPCEDGMGIGMESGRDRR
jgi:hypothetical protein